MDDAEDVVAATRRSRNSDYGSIPATMEPTPQLSLTTMQLIGYGAW
jgi:hypothetical protein